MEEEKLVKINARDGVLLVEESAVMKIGKLKEKYEKSNNKEFYINSKVSELNDVIDLVTQGYETCQIKSISNHDRYYFTLMDIYNVNHIDVRMNYQSLYNYLAYKKAHEPYNLEWKIKNLR